MTAASLITCSHEVPASVESRSRSTSSDRLVRRLLARWSADWGLPGFDSALSVEFSPRLRATLGRCRPHAGLILLHDGLRVELRRYLPKVLCHEAAHVAAYFLYGRQLAPHGPEWAALVEAAGFEPTVTAQSSSLTGRGAPLVRHSQRRSPDARVVHRCPVCHMERSARRRVPQWRCAACRAVGLDGRLEIVPLTASAS